MKPYRRKQQANSTNRKLEHSTNVLRFGKVYKNDYLRSNQNIGIIFSPNHINPLYPVVCSDDRK
jgi:hypothetical protein